MFAVLGSDPHPTTDSSVCRMSAGDCGYGDAWVNSGGICESPGDLEFGLSLVCPTALRTVRPVVANLDSMPQEAHSRRSNARVRTPCGAPGHENYTSWCVSGFSQVFVPKV